MALAEEVKISRDLAFAISDSLRLAFVYALKDSPNKELLGKDFKPWKWENAEIEYAKTASTLHRRLIDELLVQAYTREELIEMGYERLVKGGDADGNVR